MKNKILAIALLSASFLTYGQEKLKVYIDCGECDKDYLKRQITWVDYVRDQTLSDVHVWSLRQQNGGGGMHLIIRFTGQGDLQNLQYELDYQAPKMKTNLEIQRDITSLIICGLLPFNVQHGNIYAVSLAQNTDQLTTQDPEVDPWKNWVFDIGMNMGLELETNQNELELEGRIRARRITDKWRIRSDLEYDYEQNSVINNEINYVSTFNKALFEFSIVKSLSDQWSAGLFTDVQNNSARNTLFGFRINAALEYNFYPYKLSHQKEFTVAYYIGPAYMQYLEETIYGFTTEKLLSQQISIEYRLQQPWGSLEMNIDGFHYLNDLSKNRISLEAGGRIRIIKGLSLRISGEYQVIHDQIYLPKGTASIEEILLKRKSIATDYSFDFYIGLVYTFGSIYNSTVNTRL